MQWNKTNLKIIYLKIPLQKPAPFFDKEVMLIST